MTLKKTQATEAGFAYVITLALMGVIVLAAVGAIWTFTAHMSSNGLLGFIAHKGKSAAQDAQIGGYTVSAPAGWMRADEASDDARVTTFTSPGSFEVRITTYMPSGGYAYSHSLIGVASLVCANTPNQCNVNLVGSEFAPSQAAGNFKLSVADIRGPRNGHTLALVRYPAGTENIMKADLGDERSVFVQGRFVGDAADKNTSTDADDFLNQPDVQTATAMFGAFTD